MERIFQDIRFGIRSLVNTPRFTLAVVLTLALGIGANSAMFSVVRSALLRTWPFPYPSRLAVVWQRQANGSFNTFSTQDFLNWKQQGGLLANMGAYASWEFNLSSAGAQPERVAGGEVSYDWLPTLGVRPALGRFFSPHEDVAGAGNFVLLSSALWKDHYGADPEIVGKPIQLDGNPYTVVGVMPAGFNGFEGKELLWTPLQLHLGNGISSSPNIHWLSACVRLPHGVSLAQARSELDAVAAHLHRHDPSGDIGLGVYPQTLSEAYASDARPALLMLMGCVGLVLLIACANVANLLLARGTARKREMAVRAALGAAPPRIIRQLLTESVILAGAGGAAGIAVAFALLHGMLILHPSSIPRIEQASIDGLVLLYSLVVSMTVGILFGLAPALEASRVNLTDHLRAHGGSSPHGLGRIRSLLVIVETALACMLLVGTGLALKSLWALRNVQLGFEPQHLLTFRIAAPSRLTGKRVPGFYHDIVARVRALPGVESAAVVRSFPLSGWDSSMPIDTEGRASAPGEIVTRYRAVGMDYFHTLQTPLLQGRAFNEQDTANSPPVAIVSESLAREYWPGESAIGKRIRPRLAGSLWCTVVGVAADVRYWGAGVKVEPTAYYPYTQVPESVRLVAEANMGIAVRSHLAQKDLLPSIQAAVSAVDAQVPVYEVKTMESMVADSDSLRNFNLLLLGGFSLLALALAAVGVYAATTYSVSQRTQEIGIRIALGAHSGDVLRLILRQGVRLAIAGSVLGVGAALLLRKVMAGMLYGLSGNDPLILSIAPCVMLAITLLTSWLPARKSTRIDPITALRYE